MNIKSPILIGFTILCATAFAHPDHDAEKKTPGPSPLSFADVRYEFLTDPELKDFKVESSLMTIAPGAVDPVAHRHDGDLFGYVLKGSVQIGLGDTARQTYTAGQMFFEKRNIIHSLTKNLSKDQPAEILLFFIVKQGRAGYTAEPTVVAKP